MSSQFAQATPGQILRHWSIDNRKSSSGLQRPARALPYAEPADGGRLHRLASKLARVRFELKRRTR